MSTHKECQNRCEAIAALVLGELQPHAANELREHIHACQTCRSLYQAMRDEEETINSAFEAIADTNKTLQDDLVGRLQKEPHKPLGTSTLTLSTILNSRVTKLAAAAVIVMAMLLGVSIFNSTPVWAHIVRALNEVENVHIVVELVDEQGVQEECWLKQPCYLRVDHPAGSIIDDGKVRLEINKKNKTARFWDSREAFEPLAEQPVFKMTGLFRSEPLQDYFDMEATKLPNESSEQVFVYEICYQRRIKGKAWVKAETMLLERLIITGEKEGAEVTFSYEPIDDAIFQAAIPEGYTERPYLEHLSVSGKVVDEEGKPVQGAAVYGWRLLSQRTLEDVTDEKGRFMIRFVPDETGGISFPISLRAFVPSDPSKVAWIRLEDPGRREELGGTIPGEPGEIEVVEVSGRNHFAGATGVVLQMEPSARIEGRVIDGRGEPVVGAAVWLESRLADIDGTPAYHLGLGGPTKIETDTDGKYLFANLPRLWDKCAYNIFAAKEGYVLEGNRSVRVECPLETEQVNIVMLKTELSVTGSVMNNLGEPLIGYYVVAIVDETESGYGMQQTDEEGGFRLTNCPMPSQMKMKIKLLGSLRIDWEGAKLTRGREFVCYPDTEVHIDCQPGETVYHNVEIVAQKPDITLEIELKNTAGEPVRYFPVQVRGEHIDRMWSRKELTRRTDAQGRCVVTQVPRVDGLELRLNARWRIRGERLTEEQKRISRENRRYARADVPVQLVAGRKEYKIPVTLLTLDEWRRERREE